MNIQKNLKSPNEVEVIVSANEADLSPIKDKVIKKLAPQVKLPGFRPGKVPQNLIEKNLDQQVLQGEFIDEAINTMYRHALNDKDLRPVANPDVSINKFVPFTDLEIKLIVPVIGEVKLPDYKKIKLAKKTVKIDAKQVDEVLKSLAQRAAERKAVDRPAKKGDEVLIDFEGTDENDKPVNGAEGKSYPLQLGSGSFIPGFEDNLIGLEAGKDKKFSLSFPKDYGVKALRNKKVTFSVKVQAVNELVEPKLDDEFAKQVGPFSSLDDLKKDIAKQLQLERQNEADKQYEDELLRLIASKSKLNPPKQLVDEQIQRIEDEEKQNIVYRGLTWQEHLEQEGVSSEEHKEQKRPAAEERVKFGLVLAEVAEAEQIKVEPEEFSARLKLLKSQYKDETMQKELDKPEVQRELISRMITEKTIAKLVDYAGAN